jgi:hypothetical protein
MDRIVHLLFLLGDGGLVGEPLVGGLLGGHRILLVTTSVAWARSAATTCLVVEMKPEARAEDRERDQGDGAADPGRALGHPRAKREAGNQAPALSAPWQPSASSAAGLAANGPERGEERSRRRHQDGVDRHVKASASCCPRTLDPSYCRNFPAPR